MRYFKVPFLPLVLGVVLGFMVESNYRRALALSSGDHLTFLRDPISGVLLTVALLFAIGSVMRHVRDSRESARAAAAS
jgi:putative tricarboxylic transport membrane protein